MSGRTSHLRAVALSVAAVVVGATAGALWWLAPPATGPDAGSVAGTARVETSVSADSSPALIELPGDGTTVLFFGDSWTWGESADEGLGFAWQTAALGGWQADVHGYRGSGYLSTGVHDITFGEALAALPASSPALVIIQGGLNDRLVDATVSQAAAEVFGLAREKYADAEIVVLGPAPFALPVADTLAEVDQALATVAADAGLVYVSPLQDGWITTANLTSVIDPATDHPSNEGHAYLATRLYDALQELAGSD